MLERELLAEFAERLRDETVEKLAELDPATPLPEDTALGEVMLGYLEEAGLVAEHDPCPHEDHTGHRRCRVTGYSLADDSTRLDLFTACYIDSNQAGTLQKSEVARLSGWAARFFEYALKGDLVRFSGNPPAEAAALRIRDEQSRIEDVRVHVLTNALVRERAVEDIEIAGRCIEFSVWDLERLQRAAGEEVTRDRIEIDFQKLLGRPIACLEMKPPPAEYQTFLLVLPGEIVYQIYDQYGARLFEFNVRSFLQARGQVNKGIRETIKENPERFLAYNNGLTATADEIEVSSFHGETAIRRLKGLQIVNGAQTTASIHRAKKVDKLDVSKVAVSMKLTRVESSKLTEFVPLITRFANTQNPIQLADLSANNNFHIRMEQLSENIWCPGEESRWFYERARGSYQVARARYGTTPTKRREFDRIYPRSQHFGKTDIAKYLMSWWKFPYIVSRGSQKNFSSFMAELRDRFGTDWQPDSNFYKQTIALATLFKAAQSAVRRAKLPSYGANVTTYMIAKLASDYADGVDLEIIWENQEVSPELASVFDSWAPEIHSAIVESSNGRNVTEWAKKEGCWDVIRNTEFTASLRLAPEFVGDLQEASNDEGGPEEIDPVAVCCSLSGEDWAKVMAWTAQPGRVPEFDLRVAHTISGYALQGWRRRPSVKQARFGVRVVEAARRAGVLTPSSGRA